MPLQEVHTGFTFGFDGKKLSAIQRGVGRASTNLNTLAAKTEAFSQKMGGFVQRAKQVVGVYLGFRAVKSITTDYAAGADQIAKYSSALGLNAQEYQKLTHAAQLNGLTIAELNVALPNLAKNAGEAADGSKSMQLAFSRAGVSVKDSAGKLKDPITLLTEMADGLDVIKDKGRKTQILMNLFGRSGKKMGVLLAQGSEGIKKAMQEAEKLGLVLSDKQLKAGEKFTDEMLRVKAVLTGIRNTIASKLLPSLSAALEKFRTWWVEGRNAEKALRSLKLVAIFTGIVIARLIGASVLRNVKMFVQGIWAGVQALRAMGVAGAATAIKIWAIVAAFAIVALAIEDLIGFAQGKDSVIGRLLGDTKLASNLRKALLELGAAFKKAWADLVPVLKKAWADLEPEVTKLWKVIKPLIGPTFRAWIKFITFAFQLWGVAIGFVSASLQLVIGMVSAVSAAGTAAAEALTIAWEDASDFIGEALEDMGKTADMVAKAMGIDLSGAAAMVGKAWDVATAGIRKTLNTIVSAARTALSALAAVAGISKVGGLKGSALDKFVELGKKTDAGTQSNAFAPGGIFGARLAPGGLGPVPVGPSLGLGAAGGGLQQTIVNSAVASGAVQVTVNASGDAQQIAAAVNAKVQAGFNAIITKASRDLVKPPSGQR